ncbi:MAG: phage capsid family protein [Methylobacter sp.]
MAGVQISQGSALDAKFYSAAVFAGVQAAPGFMNMLSEEAPSQAVAMAKMEGQTNPGYPIVKVTDLAKNAGDRLSVDLFNIFQGKPVMGNKKLAGRGMNTSTSSMDVYINRTRSMADDGGKMNQKRTKHDLRMVIKSGLTNWATRLSDQRCMVHLAGTRGYQSFADWVVPLQTDSEFSEIMVNSVQAPTYNRRFIAGMTGNGSAATTASSMTDKDILTLSEVDVISSLLQSSNVPLQHIQMKDDAYGWDQPLWVMFVSEVQWLILKTVSGSKWQTALTNAVKRFDGSKKHPLFQGDTILWNGILIRPMGRYAVTIPAGQSVQENSSANSESAVTAAVNTHRAIIVGAQALIKAYGNEGSASSPFPFTWNEELTDHKSTTEVSIAMMEGTAKVRFTINGALTDHGVAVVDSYAPTPGTSAFNTAIGNTSKY